MSSPPSSPPDSPPDSPVMAPAKPPATQPWIEKYRPRKLDDVAHQEEVISTLKRTISSGNLPHLLLYGPPGTGKTSTILAMARELYGPELMKKRVLELNASNERGIDVIRHKVKEFAQVAVGSRDSVPGFPCPPFKIIILDEADSMTKDAQSALRRTMEQYAKVTRFAIICNYVSRIIEPITSRCAKFRYKPLSADSMTGRLKTIATAEGITLPDETFRALVDLSEGDMRKSITVLQSAQKLRGMDQQLTPADVMEVAGIIPTDRLVDILRAAKCGSFRPVQTCAQELIYSAYPASAILNQLLPILLEDESITDGQKATITRKMADADHKLSEGADEYLQILDVIACIAQTISQPV